MKAFVFPGQGSQVLGMGKSLYDNYQTARDIFNEVDDSLGLKLTKIMFDGPEEDLSATENTQPAIMSVSLAIIKVLEKDYKFSIKDNVKYLAGHSLGEYSALATANVFDIKTVANLLKIRGRAMQASTPKGVGGMVALLGINEIEKVNDLISASRIDNEVCVIANDNCIGQVVISGHMNSLDNLIQKAKDFGAKRAIKLNVSGSFHSPLMQKASEVMSEKLNSIKFNDPIIPVVSNVLAKPVSASSQIKELLIEQVIKGVRWRESINELVSLGVTEFVEIGQGNVLSGLIKKINSDVMVTNISKAEDIDSFFISKE
jgi:[acyl-carrier-protein] S-malonyltransferase